MKERPSRHRKLPNPSNKVTSKSPSQSSNTPWCIHKSEPRPSQVGWLIIETRSSMHDKDKSNCNICRFISHGNSLLSYNTSSNNTGLAPSHRSASATDAANKKDRNMRKATSRRLKPLDMVSLAGLFCAPLDSFTNFRRIYAGTSFELCVVLVEFDYYLRYLCGFSIQCRTEVSLLKYSIPSLCCSISCGSSSSVAIEFIMFPLCVILTSRRLLLNLLMVDFSIFSSLDWMALE
jgi:hypothetical protein